MPIVRTDLRPLASERIAIIRETIHTGLVQLATALIALEDLEARLGLAQEHEQDARASFVVVHVPAGGRDSHPVDDCAENGCTMTELPADSDPPV